MTGEMARYIAVSMELRAWRERQVPFLIVDFQKPAMT